MTWGSNASYAHIPCRFCGTDMIDDADSGPTSHEKVCIRRTRLRRLVRWIQSWA